ncbi:hypothetical protein HPB49_012730 [Dermacentor silvarum]|uniref:Uncharacterized protein n=1 Tax=Dermacentor silvarum TaxID=543639 RepID=A0ACB8CF70_DERSI|nr:hypothetical protein HPB49_012730 [Dermacentor silvarum]
MNLGKGLTGSSMKEAGNAMMSCNFDDPDTDATAVDCIAYYDIGFVYRKLRNGTTCSICKDALEGKKGLANVPEANLVNCKTRGWLTHPNIHLFDFFIYT